MGGIDSNLRFRVSNLSGILCQDGKYKKKDLKQAVLLMQEKNKGQREKKKKGGRRKGEKRDGEYSSEDHM